AEEAPRPRVRGRELGVEAQVPVGLARAVEREQRVAEAVVGHLVAALQALAPHRERLVTLVGDGVGYVAAGGGRLCEQRRPRGEDDLARGGAGQAEQGRVEARPPPQRSVRLRVELEQ